MAVTPPLPFANVEKVLMVALEDLGWTDTETPDAEIEVGIRINRVGGTDDGITDYPRVEISCSHRATTRCTPSARRCVTGCSRSAGRHSSSAGSA
ncbi:hypothetical protein ACFQZK_03905 [Rhodococcus aetherivorans]